MKVTFVQPSMGYIRSRDYVQSWLMQPLSIAVLAGLTPPEVEIDFYDDRLEDIPYDEPTDLVALPVETYTAKRAYDIASTFQARDVPVVMGGIHASLATEEVCEHADITVAGDAEPVWKQVLEDVREGTAKSFYQGDRKGRTLPHVEPERDLFEDRPYIDLEMVESGRGCPFTCDFCAINGSFEGNYRSKTIDDIIHDIRQLDGDHLYFVDDNFVSNPKRTKKLAKAMSELDKKWFSHGTITMAHDEELLKLLEESGCANILIGFESLNSENLDAMGKSWNKARRSYEESIQKLRDHGITIYATFVFGYEHDTEEDMKRTLDFAIDQQFALASFNHLVPFPGTPLYQRLNEEDRLHTKKWWLDEDYRFGDVAFEPINMSAETLSEGCFECRKQFYNYSSILKRGFDFQANVRSLYQGFIYLMANITNRKGIRQRQGWPVGEVVEPPAER